MGNKLIIWDIYSKDEVAPREFGFNVICCESLETILRILDETGNELDLGGEYHFGSMNKIYLSHLSIYNIFNKAKECSCLEGEITIIKRIFGKCRGVHLLEQVLSKMRTQLRNLPRFSYLLEDLNQV